MDYVGYAATVLTIGAFMPQTYKALRTRHTRDLALSTYATLVITGTLWTIYGIGRHDAALIITNTAVALLALTICVVKLQDRD
jgi:MtN3 and saliva related transmembrane protein